MSFLSVKSLQSILVIVGVLAVCAPLAAADPEGKSYEVTVSIFIPGNPTPVPVACTCLAFDALDGQQTACLRSFNSSGRQQLLALWGYSNLDLDPRTEVQATTGASLPSVCGGPRAGTEGFAFHGTVNGPTLELEVIAEVAPRLRLLDGVEIEDCSLACQP